MPASLANAARSIRRFMADVDPQRVTSGQAVGLLRDLVELERLVVAAKTLFADRASQSTTWIDEGHPSASSWLADLAKTSLGAAVSTLETSKALVELPETAEAMRTGTLSGAQAAEVAKAASKDPAAERELLELAGCDSLKHLKDRSRQVLAQSASKEDEATRARAIHERRYLRHYTDHEGALRLDVRLAPEAGGRLLSSIQAEADAQFTAARKDGKWEPAVAYRADALVALVTGSSISGRPGPSLNTDGGARRTDSISIRVDAAALRRGFVKGGETAELAGVGPVPVERIRRLLPEAFVKILVKDAVDVLSVCHVGRTVTAHVQSALEERDPTCVVPGCDVARGLENHHFVEDYSSCGTTSLAGLARVCTRHHDLISYGQFVLEGGPGKWRFSGPPSGLDEDEAPMGVLVSLPP